MKKVIVYLFYNINFCVYFREGSSCRVVNSVVLFLNIIEDDVVSYNSVFVVSIGVLIEVILLLIVVVDSSTEIGGVVLSLFGSEFSCTLRTIVVRFSSETLLVFVFSCSKIIHVRYKAQLG